MSSDHFQPGLKAAIQRSGPARILASDWRPAALSLLLPRPVDFLLKGTLLFCFGAAVALSEGQIGPQPAQLDSSLIQNAPSEDANTLFFLLFWFLIQSFIVEQAKYIWNDIRDHKRDQEIPLNQGRPLAQITIGEWTYIGLAVRWAGGLILAHLLDPRLLAIVLYFSVLQVLYELWAKPLSGRHPTFLMYIVAGGAMLRFIGGALAVGWTVTAPRLWLYGFSLFALGIVGNSALWMREANFLANKGKTLPRPHSAYFKQNGMKWMWIAAIMGFLFMAILIVDSLAPNLLAANLNWINAPQAIYLFLGGLLIAGAGLATASYYIAQAGTRLSKRVLIYNRGLALAIAGATLSAAIGGILLLIVRLGASESIQIRPDWPILATSIAILLAGIGYFRIVLTNTYATMVGLARPIQTLFLLAERRPKSRRVN